MFKIGMAIVIFRVWNFKNKQKIWEVGGITLLILTHVLYFSFPICSSVHK